MFAIKNYEYKFEKNLKNLNKNLQNGFNLVDDEIQEGETTWTCKYLNKTFRENTDFPKDVRPIYIYRKIIHDKDNLLNKNMCMNDKNCTVMYIGDGLFISADHCAKGPNDTIQFNLNSI